MINPRLTIERERRDGTEGVALCVRAEGGPPEHYQMKIDAWSIKGTGEYHLRIDGLGMLRMHTSDSIARIVKWLVELNVEDLLDGPIRRVLERDLADYLPPAELAVEYFELARAAALGELAPLLSGSQN